MTPRLHIPAPRSLKLAVILLALLAVAGGGVKLSGASFTASSANPSSSVSSSSDWTPPTVVMNDPGSPLRGTATFAATASDADSGVARVTIQRRAGDGWTTLCVDESAPYSCAVDTTTIPDGAHDLRAVADDRAGYSATSLVVTGRVVDNTPPAVALDAVPPLVSGTVTLTASAADAGTGVASVRIERSPAGAGTWTAVCTDTTAPYACALDTSALADGLYDLRAIATDVAGNMTSGALTRDVLVDNAAPTGVSAGVPGTGADNTIKGTVTVTGTATDAHSGVSSVTLQWSKAGANSWTTICVDSASPYECRFDTTTAATPDGDYDFRAVATDNAGNTTVSPTVRARIANTAPQACASPSTQTLTANADTWLDQNSPSTAFGADSILKVRSLANNNNMRLLVRFALPVIPAGCTVASAGLRLFAAASTTGRTLRASRVTAAWAEGTTTWSTQPSTAVSAGATTPSGTGWREWSVTTAVNDMYASGTAHGFMVRDDTESNASTAEQQFHSREKGGSPPQLVITFG